MVPHKNSLAEDVSTEGSQVIMKVYENFQIPYQILRAWQQSLASLSFKLISLQICISLNKQC